MKTINYQIIPGWIITILTFPGVMLHEFSHWIMCDLFNVKVHEVKFFSLKEVEFSSIFDASPVGWVIHEKPKKFLQSFFISTGPFFINTFLALILFRLMINFGGSETYIGLFFGWLAISFAVNSFPSNGDAEVLWEEGNEELKNKNYLVLFAYPIIFFIYLANLLSVIWFDFIYAYGLYYLVENFI